MSKKTRQKISYSGGFRLTDGYYTSFIIYNPTLKKNERITIIPKTQDLETALAFRKNIEIKYGITQIRAKKRFEFLQKYNDQQKLFESYIEHRKKVAKRSWKDEASRLTCYVFPYFIGNLNLNHASQWFEYWREFQYSLKSCIRNNTKTPKELTVNSKDNIIRAANSFISYVELVENGSPLKKLPEFKYEEKGQRGIESVYTSEEIDLVYREFIELNETKYADLWLILSKTGMRVGEGIGLMFEDVVFNSVPTQEKWIFKALQGKTEMYGYILLKSQPLDVNKLIIKGTVKRAPLKKRKKISPEYNRVIPLIDLNTAKTLQKLKNEVSSYNLLFEGCSYRVFYKLFVNIKKKLRLDKNRDIHSLRHTFATQFTKLCDGDPRLAEKVLGHSDPKMTIRYNHLANEMESSSLAENDADVQPLKIS
jgi:integrase